jgi:zinc and cadmium transporter
MTTFFLIILSTFFVSLLSFSGALILFLKEKLDRFLLFLVTFSAGALIGAAFFHLLPEAISEAGSDKILKIFFSLTIGFCAFFILEQFISWHHHHGREHPEIKSFSYLILVSDGIHNFIDGLIIAASFLSSVKIGTITTLAVIFHEIPQEIGDFGVLIYGGFKKATAFLYNFLSALIAILGGIVGFLISEKIGKEILYLLPFAAGTFLYIASSDLIPEIKQKIGLRESFFHFFVFLLGLSLMLVTKIFGGE